MPRLLPFILLLTLSAICRGQNATSTHNWDTSYAITLTAATFDKLVDSCTGLLLKKKFADLTDSGHIYIIMCDNTIFYTRLGRGAAWRQRFEGGRYDRFDSALHADTAAYIKWLVYRYGFHETAGLGLYFPKLDCQSGGKVTLHSLFKIPD